jgi:hypothetical protein
MSIKVIGPKDKDPLPNDSVLIYVVSSASDWSKWLSPFYVGPCELYGGYKSRNVENGWQYSKVYSCHVDNNGDPTKHYFDWAADGWASKRAQRYPMGKNVKPLYSLWEGKKLGYIDARKEIYVKLYSEAVVKTNAYKKLKNLYRKEKDIHLFDFDGYNNDKLGMTYDDVLNDGTRKMGHAFVLARLLESGA